MKKLLTLYLLLPIFLFSFNYQASWKKVEGFNVQRLPKSALEEVNKVYASAKKEHNSVQFIKSALYKKNYASTLNENGKVEAIHSIEKAIKDASNSDEKAILRSILAELYTIHLQRNYYRIHQRTAIKNSKNTNIVTWSSEDFLNKIYKLYQDSLDNKTKNIDLKKYKDILTPSKNTKALRPTLYDFLVFRALDYFTNTGSYIHQTKEEFYFKNKKAFGTAKHFSSLDFSTANPKSFVYQSTLLYQKLLNYYQSNHYNEALDYVNVLRLKFVEQHYRGDNANHYYLQRLHKIIEQNPNSEALIALLNDAMLNVDFLKALELIELSAKSNNKYIVNRAEAVKKNIMQQQVKVTFEEVNLPHQNILTKIDYRNIDHLFIKIFKLTPKEKYHFQHLNKGESFYDFIKTLKAFKTVNFSLPKTTDYQSHATEHSLGKLDIGQYLILVSPNKSFEKQHLFKELTISNLSYLEKRNRLLIVDRKTGEPLEGVEVLLKNSKKSLTRKSDSKGFVNLRDLKKNYHLSLKKGDDILDINYNRVYRYYPDNYHDNGYKTVYFFTDRSLYRPKQTIYFKGLAVQRYNKKRPKILSNQKVTVTFKNTNNQTITKQKFITDEFGAFHGKFTAPSSGRLGAMHLSSSIGGSQRIQVEEYKRPKFEVSFKPNTKKYALGNTIHIKGLAKAYAGNVLDGAKVSYRVERRTQYNWYSYGFMPPYSPPVQIKAGTITSNKKGEFEIDFVAKEDKSNAKNYPSYDFTIYADVTDSTGETHSNSTTLAIGKVDFIMQVNLKDKQNIEANNSIELNSQNLSGAFIPLKGTIDIYRFKPETKLYVKRYWQQGDQKSYTKEAFETLFPQYRYEEQQNKREKELVETIPFDTSNSKNISLNDLPQGHYQLILRVDGTPKELTQTKEFSRYSLHSKSLVEPNYLWSKQAKKMYKVGEEVSLTLKSSTPKAKVLLTLNQYNKLIEERWIELKEFTQEIIKLKKSYQGNIDYQLTMVHDNRVFHEQGFIVIPWDTKLKIEFITTRDKLKPNEKEQWSIKISGKGKEKILAQMVATIYDASLDALLPHNYAMPPLYPSSGQTYERWYGKNFQSSVVIKNWNYKNPISFQRIFPRIKWIVAPRVLLEKRAYASESLVETVGSGMGGDINPIVVSRMAPPSSYSVPAPSIKRVIKPKEPKVTIRKNLQETMYFKPDLKTDKEGNIIINFKTNEALTRWNFLAFVHTKDLKTAVAKKSFTTSKELMVTTNLPRFFREKDSITLVAKVVNMSEKDVNGTCELHLVDAVSEQPIVAKPFIKNISIEKGASTTVSFTFKVPNVDKVSALKHTIIAKTTTHSDAEEVIVPILSNRVFITESKNMFVKAHEKKSFTLESLKNNNSNTLSNHKLTLEFTSNPAWYAIRSLPYLMEFPHECNEQLFNRYFANAIASKIANSSPKIQEVFKKWKSKKELLSALETNQELKSVLLEETPWVLNAKSEDEQQANLGLLFDLTHLAEEQESAYDKLIKRQFEHKDGGWAWFESPYSNWYITQYIVEGFGKLKKLGIDKTNTEAMGVATNYIDVQMLSQYKELLKNVEKYGEKLEDDHLNSMIIHYLYARSFYKFPIAKEVQQAHDYYFNEIKNYWVNKGLYEQGMIALTLEAKGDHTTAMKIVKSLKERALVNDELGMYFKYNNGYYWNQMPIETHTLLMEVFNTVANDQESVELMKTWLLKNKQTNHWATTKATASAIYALLSDGKWLKSDKVVNVAFETTLPNVNEKIQKAEKEAGTGYFNVGYSKFDKSMATVKVNNPNDSIAWGALYWQYFEDMDKVKNFKETPLTIDKQLFLIEQTPQGEQLSPIANQPLKVGDKVKVRIEIKVDRDMEFVMLKDSRASAFEPLNVLSQYKYQDGLGYYQSTKDSATYFFMDSLRRGTYVFEYPLIVTHKGDFSNGITTMESMYAPEFRSHSRGVRVRVP